MRKISIYLSILFLSLVTGVAYGADSFSKLDRNDDAIISRSEWRSTTSSFRIRDANGDGVLTRPEFERRVYVDTSRKVIDAEGYDDDYVLRQDYPYQNVNSGNLSPNYAPGYQYNPGYYNPGYGINPGYGYNPYGINPLGVMGNANPYISKSMARTSAAIGLAGTLINSIMAFR